MKKIFFSLLLAALAGTSMAQGDTSAGGLDVAGERTRIANEKAALARKVAEERTACYQKFAVQDCLTDSQVRRREQADHLKRQEAQLNDAERKKRGAAELQRLESLKKDPLDITRNADRAGEAQQQREQRAVDSAGSRSSAASSAAVKAQQFDDKQRNAAQKQSDATARRENSAGERARYERKQQEAEAHRAELEKRNAERTKPRSPGLPDPP